MSGKQKLIVLGAGGQGRVVADIALQTGRYGEIGFLDDSSDVPSRNLPFPLFGGFSDFERWLDEADFVVALGNNKKRETVQERLSAAGATLAVLVHPRAFVASRVTLGEGTVVMAGAVLNVDTQIGRGVIINTCSSVDHDCRIDDFCHIAVGAHLAGTVRMGKRCMVGAGVAVRNNQTIVADCTIGVGAAVTSDLTVAGTYIGVPARLWRDGRCKD